MADKKTNTEVSLELLWRKFLKGDMYSFRFIYTKNYQTLYTFGTKYVSPSEAEDAIQNLFLYILQRRKSLPKINNVKSYLFISYRNRIFKILKSKNQLVFKEQLDGVIRVENTPIQESLLRELRLFLKRLSPREYEIIQLKYFQKFKNKEIASFLGVECQTVRNTLHHAIKKLRKVKFQTLRN